MKFKARIKSLAMVISSSKNAKHDSNQEKVTYNVGFEPLDKLEVCNELHYCAIDQNKVTELKLDVSNISVTHQQFDFLSQHSKEMFVITVDKKKEITDIELIYG